MESRLNDFFTQWLSSEEPGGGVFTYLEQYHETACPWGKSGIDLNLLYHGGRSGHKIASPLVVSVSEQYGGVNALSSEARKAIAAVIARQYGDKWVRLWAVNKLEYDPIQNYDMEESWTEESTHTVDRDGTTTGKNDLTRTENYNGSEAHTGTDIQKHGSTIEVITDRGTQTRNISSTLTKTGNEQVAESGVDNVTITHPDENTIVQENYPEQSPMKETVLQTGSERQTEKGGTQTSVWGFNSSSPNPSEMTIARGGTGTGGSGDGTAEGDGHVTETAFNNRSTTTTTTGSKTTTTDRNFLNEETHSTTYGKKVDTSFTSRKDSTESSDSLLGYTDTEDTTHGGQDELTHGETVTSKKGGTTTDAQTSESTDKTSETGSNTNNHTLTRKGNIGVTTSQQMAQSEIDLWQWNFFEQVFRDIDTLLTLPIY